MRLRPEASDLKGLALDCPPGCAYCCLCPPGLLDGEACALVGACEGANGYLGEDRIGDSDKAVKVRGDRGACSFLEKARCTVYQARPHFCRQYPVMVYSGWRLQVSAIRSCRGLVQAKGGPKAWPLMDIFKDEVSALGEEYYRETLVDTKQSFERIKEDRAIYAPLAEVQAAAMRAANAVGDARAIGRPLGIDKVDESRARTGILDLFWEDVESAFTCQDMIDLPVYNGPDRSWTIFKAAGSGEISAYRLFENGKLVYEASVPITELALRPLEPEAMKVLRDYLTLAFHRDIFYGMVAREAMVEAAPMKEMATDLGARIATDLWWRAGMLTTFGSVKAARKDKVPRNLGSEEAREAVIFMDADLLDAFALGAII